MTWAFSIPPVRLTFPTLPRMTGEEKKWVIRWPGSCSAPRIDLAGPPPAAEHAVVADAGLHVVLLRYGRRLVQRSCAATVWPIEQMSSRSPSMVNSAVRRIALG